MLSTLILSAFWILALEMFMKPQALSQLFVAPRQRILWWCVPPMAIVLTVFLLRWGYAAYRFRKAHMAAQAQQQAEEAREKAKTAAEQAQKDHDRYSLEVYGLGLSVDNDRFYQNEILAALEKAAPFQSVLPIDPKEYPWSVDEKGGPGVTIYEAALKDFPEKWELPFLLGGPSVAHLFSPDYLKGDLGGARTGGGMHYHRFRTVSQTYDLHPDELPKELFDLFDHYQDLPAAALAVEDGQFLRQMLDPFQKPSLLKNGHEIPSVTGTCCRDPRGPSRPDGHAPPHCHGRPHPQHPDPLRD